ncbi:MAG TPA: hypothetical protein VF781_13825 [Solirubrobacteraceae bacterium]
MLDVWDAPEAQIAPGSAATAAALDRASVTLGWLERPGLGLATRARSVLVRTQAFGPVLVVASVLAMILAAGFLAGRGNPTVFVHFGSQYVGATHPPRGAVIVRGSGYDGQYFWALARDPLLLHHRTAAQVPSFRLQRIVYPALAYVLAAGRADALPWTLLAINVMTVLGLTAAFARYARGRGESGWWGLAVGLLPGLQFATLADLSGVLAVALTLGGLMAWERERRWTASGLLATAALTREAMLLAVAAIAIEAIAQWWPRRRAPGALRRSTQAVWPVLALPATAFLTWQAYLHLRQAPSALPPLSAFQWPVLSLMRQAGRLLAGGLTVSNLWDLAYLAAILAGIVAAVGLVRRRLTAPAVAAVLFGLMMLILSFGSDWGYTRESAPLFATLLMGGLASRMRPAIAICVTVAALGVVIPFVVA